MTEEAEQIVNEKEIARLNEQIDQLANFILKEFPNEPGKETSEGAVECAIRLLKASKIDSKFELSRERLQQIRIEAAKCAGEFSTVGHPWAMAYLQLAHAANALDAMLARVELQAREEVCKAP